MSTVGSDEAAGVEASLELTVVGSGTLLPSGRRGSPAHYVEAGALRILIDAGSGAIHRMAALGLPWARLTHLLISHFHTDHIGDVAPLLFALRHAPDPPREAPLSVVGPTGTRRLLGRLAEAHGDFVLEPGFPVDVREVGPGEEVALGEETLLRVGATRHTGESVAYIVERRGVALGYTGDAGYTDELAAFLAGLDLLVAECAQPDPPEIDTHLSPRGIARLASVARPGLLLLTHAYPPLDPDDLPGLVGEAGWGGEVRSAGDGTSVALPR